MTLPMVSSAPRALYAGTQLLFCSAMTPAHLTELSNVVAYPLPTLTRRGSAECYFFFGFARTFWNARTFAWCVRAALVSIGRSLPASSSFMPLPI
jgi:hypothetical protein